METDASPAKVEISFGNDLPQMFEVIDEPNPDQEPLIPPSPIVPLSWINPDPSGTLENNGSIEHIVLKDEK